MTSSALERIAGGIAMNVIPDSCQAHVNFRYAPGRSPAEAEERLHDLTGGHGELVVESNSGSAPVALDHPLARKLIQAGALTVAPKQAWTPVAEFAADYNDLFRRAAGFVDKILKGAKPATMPVEPPRKFDLTVNLKTAKAIGLTIPPEMLAAADEVIK